MQKRFVAMTLAMAFSVGVLGLGLASAGAPKFEEPSIKDVMKSLNGKGATTESAKLRKALSAAKPDWDAIQASTKVYAESATALSSGEPPKGSKDSWKKMTDAFSTQTKALDEAAGKKDVAGVKGAFGKISMGCMGCHRQHKG